MGGDFSAAQVDYAVPCPDDLRRAVPGSAAGINELMIRSVEVGSASLQGTQEIHSALEHRERSVR